jgi:RNA polymerase sigma-70 factor (ECF subfamily)
MSPGGISIVTTRSNAEWLAALRASGAEQAAAITELRSFVLRAALYALRRGRGHLGLMAPSEIDQLAEDCTQDAMLAILQHLDQFRGESRFTTWVYAFAINKALVAARREGGKRVPLERLLDHPGQGAWPALREEAAPDPHRRVLQGETLAVIREAIDRHLSDRQRRALKAIILEGVPLDEVARHWGSNRNAVYKLLHDARRKLKAHLEARGFGVREMLGLFESER